MNNIILGVEFVSNPEIQLEENKDGEEGKSNTNEESKTNPPRAQNDRK